MSVKKRARVIVIPHVWQLSVDMWFLHPSLTHAVSDASKAVSDCLHYCVVGDGYGGI